MPKPRPFSDAELAYIDEHYPAMTGTEIARAMGRSKSSVYREIGRITDTAPVPGEPSLALLEGDGELPPDGPEGTEGRRRRLRELRTILRNNIVTADPRQLAGLSREYRSVIAEIAALEASETDDHGSLADIVALVSGDLPA